MAPADEERANEPGAYEKALPILAARYKAFQIKEVDVSKRTGSKFVRLNEKGDVFMIDDNNEEFVASANAVHVFKFVGDEERTELVFFDSDDIANMKYLRDDEKMMYRSMLTRVVIEQRYPGKCVTCERLEGGRGSIEERAAGVIRQRHGYQLRRSSNDRRASQSEVVDRGRS